MKFSRAQNLNIRKQLGGAYMLPAIAPGVDQILSAWPQLISRFGIFMQSAWIYR
jgi:hypothetical protein